MGEAGNYGERLVDYASILKTMGLLELDDRHELGQKLPVCTNEIGWIALDRDKIPNVPSGWQR